MTGVTYTNRLICNKVKNNLVPRFEIEKIQLSPIIISASSTLTNSQKPSTIKSFRRIKKIEYAEYTIMVAR